MKELLDELQKLHASIDKCCDIARQNNDSELFYALRALHWKATEVSITVEEKLGGNPAVRRAELS